MKFAKFVLLLAIFALAEQALASYHLGTTAAFLPAAKSLGKNTDPLPSEAAVATISPSRTVVQEISGPKMPATTYYSTYAPYVQGAGYFVYDQYVYKIYKFHRIKGRGPYGIHFGRYHDPYFRVSRHYYR